MKASAFPACIAFFLCVRTAQALIVYESGTSVDNTYNTTAPGNGAPWQYVGQIVNSDPTTNGSAVYLGNNFMITANHVTLAAGATVTLDGTSYSIDTGYTPLQLGQADLKLFKIIGNTGLATLPLTTASTGRSDLGRSSTLICYGEGKGSVVTQSGSNVGWTWGGDTTYAQRWGTNITLSGYGTDENGVIYLETAFNVNLGANVTSDSEGDSGSALFQKYGNTWKLAGIVTGVDTSGTSFYADSPNNNSGMDYSYAVEIEPYSSQISAAVPTAPAPLAPITPIALGVAALIGYSHRLRALATQQIS